LESVPLSGLSADREGEQEWQVMRAQTLLMLGRAVEVPAILGGITEASLRPTVLALQVDVTRVLGHDLSTPLQEIRTALTLGTLAPLDQLRLHRTDPNNPQGAGLARTLAATLPPERRPAFLARWLTPVTASLEPGDPA
jgi:hypothetical protein